ncbi:uncharacterized protein [Musca autumnalis]|uniref:uncharacterized protein n=1 Tax=Musca autumnalis TaxID=221902 RepID=UPI003CF3AA1C
MGILWIIICSCETHLGDIMLPICCFSIADDIHCIGHTCKPAQYPHPQQFLAWLSMARIPMVTLNKCHQSAWLSMARIPMDTLIKCHLIKIYKNTKTKTLNRRQWARRTITGITVVCHSGVLALATSSSPNFNASRELVEFRGYVAATEASKATP